MSGKVEANSAKFAEIRARAEDALKYGEPSGFGQLARDVLALIEVAEGAQALGECRERFPATYEAISRHPEFSRLEQALSKFDFGGL